MRIQEINTRKVTSDFVVDDKKNKMSTMKFEDAIESEISKVQDNILNEMLADIDNTAQKLKENLNIENLLSYKKKVKQFLQNAINGMFRRNKRESIDIRGRKKIYTIIDKINDKLEKLTMDFLNNNSKNIDLLNTIEEIRGLLVDIYS
ncbi:YaaR family protein [Thermoanaerobacterium sp. RBIITD]|uniref:YaaR family protein n=1 Tax=Thermoanaerobacterium sp. RBIITD TaxID=1550240 RepID=UPI000BB8C960|nr:YaaR family protein [Thermoanaerobacterium sp. RBIITD]SNX53853.1 hypothetical protein SAMN05660242_1466 [Thermoanaerobacterium sp. RBIITD]